MSASAHGGLAFENFSLVDYKHGPSFGDAGHFFPIWSILKQRLDTLITDRGITPSRERAQALIIAGRVLVNEQKVMKPGAPVGSDAVIRLLGDDLRYVSRGGLKLERALQFWQIDVSGITCMDVGASTGGFTDCLLQHGAASVIAIDTGYGQIDMKLRNDPRVELHEKTNARFLNTNDVSRPVDLLAMDVSFISATLVLPAVVQASRTKGVIVLVKPQFEAGREHVGKGGIVRDETAQKAAVEKVKACLQDLGFDVRDPIDSPILGAEGNREFLLYGIRD